MIAHSPFQTPFHMPPALWLYLRTHCWPSLAEGATHLTLLATIFGELGCAVFWVERGKLLIDNKRSILPSLHLSLFICFFGPRTKEEELVELEVTENCVDCTAGR